ncbi:MAG: DUF2063 domain-containing protein [Rhodothermales bacterium]|nr:DUF2063 domain-containing protein [Rhodothermales bacterium]
MGGDACALSGLLQSHVGPTSTGINVYQNNVRETFRLALAASYPVIEALTGPECFAGLTFRYLGMHPSSTPDLQAFGEQFPEFLDGCYSGSSYQYVADVARLELATEQVLLDREVAPLDPGRLADIPAAELPELKLDLAPACRLVTSGFPILSIWRMHNRADSEPVSLDAGPSHVLVRRCSGDAVLREISAIEFMLAYRLSRGDSISRAFETLSDISGVAVLQTALASLLSYRVFSNFH